MCCNVYFVADCSIYCTLREALCTTSLEYTSHITIKHIPILRWRYCIVYMDDFKLKENIFLIGQSPKATEPNTKDARIFSSKIFLN